ncbi:MAG TPA: peptidylprolyl isomerase [Polyangiaceae bacterium]|nr:peptidylprolyl isomerase [Polyangiaceae bacterium]
MQPRRLSVALGGALVVACSLLVWRGGARRPPGQAALLAASGAAPLPPLASSFVLAPVVPPAPTLEGPRLPRAQALPPTAPRRIRFGVVLVQYRGVQLAPDAERSRAEAFALAERLAAVGRVDFARAVQQGDDGSTVDAGRIDRGILEPGLEYELFSLERGAVSQPIDTPRGFWVVRRIE